MELMQASHQWATRPADERFTSLLEMQGKFIEQRRNSRALVVSNRQFELVAQDDHKGLVIQSQNGHEFAPTNWAFSQLCQRSNAPASYLRKLPAELAADNLNWSLRHDREVEELGLLVNADPVMGKRLQAATGPDYGRIWNADITTTLVNKFGDGVSGDWTVPGMFGVALDKVTKENTTLFAGDRDMFVFLANEKNKIEVPNRRNGQAGTMSRGFFVWNSEVGSKTFGISTFYFDYVCCNRIVWGAENVTTVTLRHTKGAPDRWLEELQPALDAYANQGTGNIKALIHDAQQKRIDDVDAFLIKRQFSKRQVQTLKDVHLLEEGKPIETIWDATTAVTALAKSINNQDDRVAMEKQGGDILKLVA